MHKLIPLSVQPLLQAYLDALGASGLRSHYHGIYLYGSIPLEAFDERTSDVDAIALTQRHLSPAQLERLEAIHQRLAQEHAFGRRLAVMYVPLRDLGKRNAEVPPYSYFADGEFHASGHFDLNGVAWWLLKRHGIALLGPEPQALQLAAPWEDVIEDMRYNLNTYWPRLYAGLSANKDIVLDDYSIVYCVSTLCRILSTVEDGEIPTKPQALLLWRDRLPDRFHGIVDEALRIRQHSDAPSLYASPGDVREEMLEFMGYAMERGNRALEA